MTKWLPRKSRMEAAKVSQATTVTKCIADYEFDHLASYEVSRRSLGSPRKRSRGFLGS